MDFEELRKQIDIDLRIDDTELDLESIRTPQIHNKYLQLYTKYSLQLKKARDDYNSLYRTKWEYYTGKAEPEVYRENPFDIKVLKADVGIYLNSDLELQQQSQRVEYVKQYVDYLERILREITNRGFHINNTIKWKQFLHGE
ncbi:MAG: recombination mediator protein UvsY [Candidatus Pacebacteria bacterium]|jgi:hypothetical protein|nr:recombination mediator protein UvsY [Candidatus Paceibacterota bacterium]MDP7367521.1 recombination mediator protein UvsY [Candidatus Paceibacterota bacterium]|tara:strand:- start:1528 stop:1953 length:426 start_codon:yes stop_codon:yes gene_type:complete